MISLTEIENQVFWRYMVKDDHWAIKYYCSEGTYEHTTIIDSVEPSEKAFYHHTGWVFVIRANIL